MSSNTTHRKQLARAYSVAAQLPYQRALAAVTQAAEAGRLPSPLDEHGQRLALAMLLGTPPLPASADVTAAPAPVERPGSSPDIAEVWRAERKRLRLETVIALHQVADLLDVGVQHAFAWQHVANATPHERVRATAAAVADAVKDGRALADVLGEHKDVFLPVTAVLLAAGEQGGILVQSLRKAADGLKRDVELRQP